MLKSLGFYLRNMRDPLEPLQGNDIIRIYLRNITPIQRMNTWESVQRAGDDFDSFCENWGEKWLKIIKEMTKGVNIGETIRDT